MARISKIAKLPPSIREDLNLRLERSETARSIIEWLNPMPEVQELLKLHFNGDAVNEQNITNWRRSGFAVWQTRQEFMDRLQDLSDEKTDLSSAATNMIDHAARLLSIHFAMMLSPSSRAFQSSSSSSSIPTPSSGFQSKRSSKSTPSTPSDPSSSPLSTLHDHSSILRVRTLCVITRAVVSLRRSEYQVTRFQPLIDKPRSATTKDDLPSLAEQSTLICSHLSKTGNPSGPGLPGSPNINQDISTYSAAPAPHASAPASQPQPPRAEHSAPHTRTPSLQRKSRYSNLFATSLSA